MKWHKMGNGKEQLRLFVALIDKDFYLCQAYCKGNEKFEKRELKKFKTRIEFIMQETFIQSGVLKCNH